MARLACTKPGARPAVMPANFPRRMSARISFGWRASIGISSSQVSERVRSPRAASRDRLRHPLARTQLFKLRTGLGGPTSLDRARRPAAPLPVSSLLEMAQLGPEVGIAEDVGLLAT